MSYNFHTQGRHGGKVGIPDLILVKTRRDRTGVEFPIAQYQGKDTYPNSLVREFLGQDGNNLDRDGKRLLNTTREKS